MRPPLFPFAHVRLAFIRTINSALDKGETIDAAELTRIARELEALAGECIGQTPLEIEAFIRAHGAPAS